MNQVRTDSTARRHISPDLRASANASATRQGRHGTGTVHSLEFQKHAKERNACLQKLSVWIRCPGKGTAICAALTDCEAAVSVNDGGILHLSRYRVDFDARGRSVANAGRPGHYAAVFRWNT
jgi:hypothetical protein